MHPLAIVALALVVFAARSAQAQAPPGFVDAAAVVEGLVVDMRYATTISWGRKSTGTSGRAACCPHQRRARSP
jgi:D-alanyl-D-alanine dipeptidase